MKFGIAVTTSVSPATTSLAQADYVTRLAVASEKARFDSIWVSDRTVFPANLATRYPEQFGAGGANPEAQNVLEALTTLSYLAGMVKSIRLGLSVLVLPFRNPVLNAKMITTLDVLSQGRVIFGIGTGWMPEEFEAIGVAYADRGTLTNEHIELFKELCSQDVANYAGKHYQISNMVFFPKPLQQPHPPIWVGGNTNRALKRAAVLGDGWHGIRLGPKEVADKRRLLGQFCQQNRRNPDEVTVSLRLTLDLDQEQYSPDGSRLPLTGSTAQIADDLNQYEQAGVEYIVLSVAGQNSSATVTAIERFAETFL